MRPNRHPGPCTVCTTHVPAGAGTVIRAAGQWRVHCADHPADAAPGTRQDDQAPAEIRLTGTTAEVTALTEALQQADHIEVLDVSAHYPRREDTGRFSAYVTAQINPRLLQAIEREQEPTR